MGATFPQHPGLLVGCNAAEGVGDSAGRLGEVWRPVEGLHQLD